MVDRVLAVGRRGVVRDVVTMVQAVRTAWQRAGDVVPLLDSDLGLGWGVGFRAFEKRESCAEWQRPLLTCRPPSVGLQGLFSLAFDSDHFC